MFQMYQTNLSHNVKRIVSPNNIDEISLETKKSKKNTKNEETQNPIISNNDIKEYMYNTSMAKLAEVKIQQSANILENYLQELRNKYKGKQKYELVELYQNLIKLENLSNIYKNNPEKQKAIMDTKDNMPNCGVVLLKNSKLNVPFNIYCKEAVENRYILGEKCIREYLNSEQNAIIDNVVNRQKKIVEHIKKSFDNKLKDGYYDKEVLYQQERFCDFFTSYAYTGGFDYLSAPKLKISVMKQDDNNFISLKNEITNQVFPMKVKENTFLKYIKPNEIYKQDYKCDCTFISFLNSTINSEENFIKFCSLFEEDDNGNLTVNLNNGDSFKFQNNEIIDSNFYFDKINETHKGGLLLEQAINLSKWKTIIDYMMSYPPSLDKKCDESYELLSKEDLEKIKQNFKEASKHGSYQKIVDIIQKKLFPFFKNTVESDDSKKVSSIECELYSGMKLDMEYLEKNCLDISFSETEIAYYTGIVPNFMHWVGSENLAKSNDKKFDNLIDEHSYFVMANLFSKLFVYDSSEDTLRGINLYSFVQKKIIDLDDMLNDIAEMKKFPGNDKEKSNELITLKEKIFGKSVEDFKNYYNAVLQDKYNKNFQVLIQSKLDYFKQNIKH